MSGRARSRSTIDRRAMTGPFRSPTTASACLAGSDAPKAGLGTGIVEALAKNLQGEIQLSDAGPGTAVTISHQESADLRTDLSTAA